MISSPIWYDYFTEAVAAKAREDGLLQELVLAVVHAAADFDMYATSKADPDNQDHGGSYEYFRDLVNRLGIPPQAILDVIDECFPDDDRDNLTESGVADDVEVETVRSHDRRISQEARSCRSSDTSLSDRPTDES